MKTSRELRNKIRYKLGYSAKVAETRLGLRSAEWCDVELMRRGRRRDMGGIRGEQGRRLVLTYSDLR